MLEKEEGFERRKEEEVRIGRWMLEKEEGC